MTVVTPRGHCCPGATSSDNGQLRQARIPHLVCNKFTHLATRHQQSPHPRQIALNIARNFVPHRPPLRRDDDQSPSRIEPVSPSGSPPEQLYPAVAQKIPITGNAYSVTKLASYLRFADDRAVQRCGNPKQMTECLFCFVIVRLRSHLIDIESAECRQRADCTCAGHFFVRRKSENPVLAQVDSATTSVNPALRRLIRKPGRSSSEMKSLSRVVSELVR